MPGSVCASLDWTSWLSHFPPAPGNAGVKITHHLQHPDPPRLQPSWPGMTAVLSAPGPGVWPSLLVRGQPAAPGAPHPGEGGREGNDLELEWMNDKLIIHWVSSSGLESHGFTLLVERSKVSKFHLYQIIHGRGQPPLNLTSRDELFLDHKLEVLCPMRSCHPVNIIMEGKTIFIFHY